MAIEQVVDAAVDVMAEQGAAGLSLGERPAVVALDRGRGVMARLQALGLFRPDVPIDELMKVWTIVTSGVITQRLANAPQEPFETGAFTSMLPEVVEMYRAHYAPRPHSESPGGNHADRG